MEQLTEDVLKTFNERKTISSKVLLEKYELGILSKIIGDLVKRDLIVLDELPPNSVWTLKKKQ